MRYMGTGSMHHMRRGLCIIWEAGSMHYMEGGVYASYEGAGSLHHMTGRDLCIM